MSLLSFRRVYFSVPFARCPKDDELNTFRGLWESGSTFFDYFFTTIFFLENMKASTRKDKQQIVQRIGTFRDKPCPRTMWFCLVLSWRSDTTRFSYSDDHGQLCSNCLPTGSKGRGTVFHQCLRQLVRRLLQQYCDFRRFALKLPSSAMMFEFSRWVLIKLKQRSQWSHNRSVC